MTAGRSAGDGPGPGFARRVADVRARVAAAAIAAGRSPDEVTIVAVTKTHPPSVARAAVAVGLADLGENRVDELLAKRPHVPGARWHLVGRLQRNKVARVVGTVALVHSVDRADLVDALERHAAARGLVQPVLLQVNVGDDPAKGGCSLAGARDLLAYARARTHLSVEGLMTVPPLPPLGADPVAAARPHFASLRRLRDDLRTGPDDLPELSMGMSDDLEAAVAEGATVVRIGSALFGGRGGAAWTEDSA